MSTSGLLESSQRCAFIGEMRAEVLVVWVSLTLCCVLVCTGEDVKEDKVSTGRVQVRETRGLVKHRRQEEAVGDVEMADEPAEVVEAEKTKPKKKKTPEEIEAGK